MCRLFAFRSSVPSQAHRSLIAAENALVKQSELHPDGWGIAYYVHNYPHLYRNPSQAIEDGLFRELGNVVSTYTLLGHIRKATAGDLSLLNCHPFQYGNWVFAHNGEIAGFPEDPDLRARIRELVAPRFRRHILGETDSEVIFYIFLSHLVAVFDDLHVPGLRVDHVREALRRTMDQVLAMSESRDGKTTKLTIITTNGNLMVGSRWRMPLNYSTYKTVCPERDSCPAFEQAKCEAPVTGGIVKHLILTSEKVSENPNVWTPLEDEDEVSVDWGMHFERTRPSA